MLPHERSLVKDFQGRPFSIIGVNSDSKKRLQELVADGTVTWRNFADINTNGKISLSWGINAWPTIYLIDHKGVIRHKGLRGERMEAAITALVAEAEKERTH